MAVSYKRLLHMMIEKDVSNAQLMHDAGISANIITKLKNGQYIAPGQGREYLCCYGMYTERYSGIYSGSKMICS